MGLSKDQKAMLRLLAQREQGYEDIAALMGLSVDEVRARVMEALAQIDEDRAPAAKPPEAAEPPPPPAAPEPLKPEAEEAPAPQATEPQAPAVRPPEAPARPPAAGRPSPLSRLSLPKDRDVLIGLAAGAGVILILVVALVIGGGGGGDSSTDADTAATTPTEPTAAEGRKLTQAVLSPVDGGDASGRALFGRVKNSVVLQVEAQGLDTSAKGQSYAIWLARSPKLMVPLAVATVDDSGKIAAQYPLPSSVLAYLASGAFDEIAVSLVSNAPYKASLVRAGKEKKAPTYTGADVLRGAVTGPIVGAAKRQ